MRASGVRVYADTSVIGGAFDVEFAGATLRFLEQVNQGHYALVTSVVVRDEVARGPQEVRDKLTELLPAAEVVGLSSEALQLRDAYVEAGIVSPRWAADALHVALATVAGCPLIVSWNFRHIVHYQKVPLYNAVNEAKGYRELAICSPPEVILYLDADEEAL